MIKILTETYSSLNSYEDEHSPQDSKIEGF